MEQTTIRFYEERKGHKEAWQILKNCKSYGFENANHMMIELLLAYEKREDILAEAIARKVVEKLGEGLVYSPFSKEENDTFLKACAFMDEL